MAQETESIGLVEKIKNFSFKETLHTIKAYEFNWTEMGIGFIAGCTGGFLFKRYFKTIFFFGVGALTLLFVLHHFDFIQINIAEIKTVMGIDSSLGSDSSSFIERLCTQGMTFVKAHASMFMCGSIGFLCGYKLL